ncbi:LPS export ABC transporter permease LptF [Ectothiorhodospiraceae bacterium BW-2]|nr:LPS export ABC transporter permease LptF [Ectothiorhodospiraceae bacterium BW-2]
MIAGRYLFKELLLTTVAVTAVMLLILLSATLVKVLTGAAGGEYPAELLLALFALKLIGPLAVILPLALFLAVLLALGRLSADYELYALFACGGGYGLLLRSGMGLALLVALLLWLIELWFAPWADEQRFQLLDQARAETGVDGVVAGRFQSLGSEQTLYVTEALEPAQGEALAKVMLFSRQPEGGVEILTAERVEQQRDRVDNSMALNFSQGEIYRGSEASLAWQRVTFSEYWLRLPHRPVVSSTRRDNAIPTLQLLQQADIVSVMELYWRLSGGVMALVLVLLAIPLGRSEPRQGRFGRFFYGLLLYFVYYNALLTARSLIEKEGGGAELFWLIHLLFAALALIGLWQLQRLPRVVE